MRTWRPGGPSSTPTRPSTPSSARSCPAASRSGRWRSTSTSSRGSPRRSWTPGWPAAAFDFVDAVAKEVPIRVLARIMGLPGDDLDTFIDLGDRLIANTDPEITDVVWGRDDTDAYRRYPFRSPYGKQLWDLGREIVAGPAAPTPATTCCPRCCGPRLTATGSARPTSTTSSRSWSSPGTRPPGSRSPRGCWPSASTRSSGTGCAPTRACWTPRPKRCCGGAARPTSCGGPRPPTPSLAARTSGPATRWCSGTCPATGTRREFDDPETFDIGRSPNRHLSFGRGGPAPVPGRPPGPAGGAHRARRAGPAGGPVRAGRAAAPDPVELHQRAQGAAGPGLAGMSRAGAPDQRGYGRTTGWVADYDGDLSPFRLQSRA